LKVFYALKKVFLPVFLKVFYGPPDWVVDNISSHTRRAIWFWIATIAAIIAFFMGTYVFYVTILSVIALYAIFSGETPVELEKDTNGNQGD